METNTWTYYITEKFASDDFTHQYDNLPLSFGIYHKKTGTSIIFYWKPGDKIISDIQFYNNKTEGWSGEFGQTGEFCEKEKERVDLFLKPVLETGWISKDTYLFGKHWRSKVYFDNRTKSRPFYYYSSDLGCLSVLGFPVFAVLAIIVGQSKTVNIPPINQN